MARDMQFVDLRAGGGYRVRASAEHDGLLITDHGDRLAGFFSRLGALETAHGAWQALVRPTRLGFGVKCDLLCDGQRIGQEFRRPGVHRYALRLMSGTSVALHTRYSGRWEAKCDSTVLAQLRVDDTFLRQRRPFNAADESGDAGFFEIGDVDVSDHDRDALLMFSLAVVRADMISEGGKPPLITGP